MESLSVYYIESSVFMAAFYAFYKIALCKETFFALNRIYLLSALLLSLILPALDFSFLLPNSPIDYSATLQAITIESGRVQNIISDEFSSPSVLLYIYLTGCAVLILNLIRQAFIIINIISKSEKKIINGRTVFISSEKITPFSIFSKIILNPEGMTEEDLAQVIAHEEVHIIQRHSFSVLFVETVLILQWFNPFIYLFRHSIKENHEFIADHAVLSQGYDKSAYMRLLYGSSAGTAGIAIAGHLNYSLIKRRFSMMTNSRTGRLAALKFLPLIPIIALLIAVKSGNAAPKSYGEEIKTGLLNEGGLAAVEKKVNNAEFDEAPVFGTDLATHIKNNLKYPESARKSGKSGKVIISVKVNEKGKITKTTILKGVRKDLNNAALDIVKKLPDFQKPAMKDGKPVACELKIPIQFRLDNKTDKEKGGK